MTRADRRARFEDVFREHARDLLAYGLRRTSDPAGAADVVAETFTTAWRRIDRVPGGRPTTVAASYRAALGCPDGG